MIVEKSEIPQLHKNLRSNMDDTEEKNQSKAHTLQSSLMMKNEKGLFWEKGKNAFLSFKNEQILSAE